MAKIQCILYRLITSSLFNCFQILYDNIIMKILIHERDLLIMTNSNIIKTFINLSQ